MSEGRTLMNFQKVEKVGVLDRVATTRAVTDAGEKAERKLLDRAQHFFVTGWKIDTEYGVNGFDFNLVNHTVVGRLRLVRPD